MGRMLLAHTAKGFGAGAGATTFARDLSDHLPAVGLAASVLALTSLLPSQAKAR
jgi:hypothetical protein